MSDVRAVEEAGAVDRSTYLEAARQGEHRWWRHLVGWLIILVAWLVIGTAASLSLTYVLSGGVDPTALNPLAAFVVTMLGYPFFFASIVLVVTRIHRRPLRTLITARERVDWRRVGHGFVAWLAPWCLVRIGQYLLAPGSFTLNADLAALLLFVPLALVLTAIQTTTEELFFRGYAVQSASLIWGNRIFLSLVSALLFTLIHLTNPEAGAGGWLTIFFGYFLGTGMVWIVVSLIDGTTELAIGAHFANNIATILLVGTAGTVVSTPALFTVAEYDATLGALSTLVIVPLFMVTALRLLKRDPARAR
jgi:uncharacterized protein